MTCLPQFPVAPRLFTGSTGLRMLHHGLFTGARTLRLFKQHVGYWTNLR